MYGGSRSKFHKDRRLLGRVLTIFTLGERRWSVKPGIAGSHCGVRIWMTYLREGDAPGLHG
jgi:hypothetical protein